MFLILSFLISICYAGGPHAIHHDPKKWLSETNVDFVDYGDYVVIDHFSTRSHFNRIAKQEYILERKEILIIVNKYMYGWPSDKYWVFYLPYVHRFIGQMQVGMNPPRLMFEMMKREHNCREIF